ncbi:PAS domain-containing protein [Sporocytophaga myxococcoides]|uniref:PAS domain-containing protein n=1 Tax=Sporocytophaga myxococcoides TaxID=153721 RepID=UPI0004036DFB|nr:PAS domain-containing protein [Sporocytophaga myxococcoides]
MGEKSLKDYADFLNKNYSDDIYNFYLSEIESESLNIIPIYNINKEDREKLVKFEIQNFIALLKDNKIINGLNEWNNSFKTEGLYFPEYTEWEVSQVISIFNNRKKSLNFFLSTYVTQVADAIELNNEMDHFFSGQVNALIKIIEDLQKRNLQELKVKITSTENLLNQAESSSHIGHCELDYVSGKVKCSEEFYKILGVNLDFKLEIPFLKNLINNENDFDPFLKESIPSYKEDKTSIHEFKIKRPDQPDIQCMSNEFPVVDDSGNIVGSKIIIQDITDLKEIDSELKAKDNLIDRIIQYSPTLILIYDIEEGKIVFVNEVVHQLLGYSVKSILDLNIKDSISTFIHEDDIVLVKKRIKSYSDISMNEVESIEFRVIDSNKEVHWFHSKTIVFNSINNNVKQILINATEITSFKKLQEIIFLKEAQYCKLRKSPI